jgi:hypothetical protein
MGAARAESVAAVIAGTDDRRLVLARFIRSQANLTDRNPPQIGPGSIHLNHEEALLCADALEAQVRETADGKPKP